jgi:hypothetical protein
MAMDTNASLGSSGKQKERFISALSGGAFLILVGIIFIMTPNFFSAAWDFFVDFAMVKVPNTLPGFSLPAPKNPASHTIVYTAAMNFSLAWGIFLVGLLLIRIFANSPLQKKAENFSDIVSWLGSSFLVTEFLNETTTATRWFAYWAALIMLIGASLIVRATILAIFKVRRS